jgi:hypothetical protein
MLLPLHFILKFIVRFSSSSHQLRTLHHWWHSPDVMSKLFVNYVATTHLELPVLLADGVSLTEF